MKLTITIELDVLTDVAAKTVVEDFFTDELEEFASRDGLRVRQVHVNLEQKYEKSHSFPGGAGLDGCDQ
tara:strand:+ start:511 stop:717 length:207 start_codon:yes stop_codon:yes gene_type:complete